MSYPLIPLGNLAKFINGDRGKNYPSKDSFVDEGIPFINAGCLSDQLVLDPKKFNYITEESFNLLSSGKIQNNDILFCLRGSVGKFAVIRDDNKGALASSLIILRVNEKVDVEYLKHYLFSSLCVKEISNYQNGAAQPNLSAADLKKFLVPLPPLEEQRRIAAVLDKADKLRQKRQQAIEKLDQLLQATFIDMFGDPVLNTKNWPSNKKLGDIADIVSGITKGRKITGKSLREIPYLAVSNVQDKYLNLSVIKTIEASDEEIERYKLQQGDLLLTEGGDPDKLGRGTLWNNEVDECIHQNHVFRVRLTSKNFTPNYLHWIVGSEYGKRYFLKSAKQTTGIASINMGQLKKLPLLTPPLDLQMQFDERCNKFHQIKKQLAESYKDINNLFKSLQNQAFSGNL